MKKVILFSALAVTGFISQAQTTFGIQAGANFASAKAEYGTTSYDYKTKTGLTIGALADVPFGGSISFRPELNFIQKGGKREETTTQAAGGITETLNSKEEYSLGYIQLSPNFVYNIPAGKGKLFLGLGPEFSFGMGGKYKSSSTYTLTGGGFNESESDSDNSDVKFDGDKDANDDNVHFKGFDFGMNILAGYKLAGGFFMSAGYTMGFGNISPYDNSEFKNRGFNIKLGYMFGGMNKK